MKLTDQQMLDYEKRLNELKSRKSRYSKDDSIERAKIQADIEEIQDILAGRPPLQELSDEQLDALEKEYDGKYMAKMDLSMKDPFGLVSLEKTFLYGQKASKCRQEQMRRRNIRKEIQADSMTPEFMAHIISRVQETVSSGHYVLSFCFEGIYVETSTVSADGLDYDIHKVLICLFPFPVESPNALWNNARTFETYAKTTGWGRSLKKFDLWPASSMYLTSATDRVYFNIAS